MADVAAHHRATVPFDDLPDTAEVTGQAIKRAGFDARGEANAPSVVLEFRREKLELVRRKLKELPFDEIEITDIRFL